MHRDLAVGEGKKTKETHVRSWGNITSKKTAKDQKHTYHETIRAKLARNGKKLK